LIQIASAPSLGIFANLNTITVSVSTSGQAIGKIVGVGATGLDPNTTYYSQVFLRDSDGDVSPLYTTEFTTFTTLAAAPTVGALEFLSVQTASVTVAWIAPYQLTVASQTNEGYILQASSDNFGGIAQATPAPIFSSTTFNVQSTTLTVGDVGAPLDLGNTYYFQVASLNWQGKPNYATFTKLNFQIAQSTGLLHFGGINPDIARSSVSTSSMVVTNVGNWPVTIQLTGSTATVGGSPWSLGTVPGIEQATLMGTWYSGALGPPAVGPPASEFTTFLTTTPFISSNGGGGNYQGNQDGVQIPPGQSRTLWFYFTMPMSSISLGPESFAVGSQPLFP
jgi:hypothetical protein